MPESYYILLVGMKPQAEDFALSHFKTSGHRVARAASIRQSAEVLQDPQLNLAFLQPSHDANAADELRQVNEIRPGLPVVLICGHTSAADALAAWHSGAVDAILMPFDAQSLDASLQRAVRSMPAKDDTEVHARFRYLDESGKERMVSIIPPRFTIGRSSNNDLVLSQMNISRSQAEILVADGQYLLKDMGSKHGTYVNGVRVEQSRLTDGDRIQLGGLQGQSLTFHLGDLLQSLLGNSDARSDVNFTVRGFKEIGMLLATFRALSSIPLLDDLLSLVVDTAIELTEAERGFIMLKDKNDELQFRCARNSYKKPLDGSSFQTSRRVPDEVFKTGKRVVINDLDIGDSDDHTTTRRLGVRSICCIPLRYLAFRDAINQSGIGRMENIGVLYVDSQSIGAGLSNTRLEALETLASEAAMAIYNARLYKESQEKRKMDADLANAREIQQALMPTSNKILSFVRAYSQNIPCHEVGGDYLDYFDFDDGRLGFALGDVSGKGMPAALLSSVIQGMFSAQTLLDLPVPSILSNVNQNLVRRGTGNRFVTLFFGILDSEGNCTYSNAGHNPPILLKRDGSICELKEGGLILGLFPDAQYASANIRLQPGDHLVLFTDGVLEARNTKGDEFGEERLHSLLREHASSSAQDILARLQEAIAAFSAGTPQHDDITMMTLGFQELEAGKSLPTDVAQSIA